MNRIEQLLNYIANTPNDQFLHHALALEYIKVQDYEQAMARFEQNLAINDQYVATYYHYGQLLDKLGKTEAAISIYEKGMVVAKNIGDSHAYGELRSVYEELTF